MGPTSSKLTERSNFSRVSLVSTYPPDRCGVAYYTLGLVKGMRGLVDLHIVANKTNGIVSNDAAVVKCWKKDSVFYPLSILIECVKTAGRLIHLQHHYTLYGGALPALEFPLILIGLKIIHKPFVVTLHSIIPKSKLQRQLFQRYGLGAYLSGFKRTLMILLVKSIVLLSDAVIVHDSYMKKCLIKDYGANSNKTFIVPHGVFNISSLECKRAKALLGLPDQKVILYQGFITDGKGVEILIRAFRQVHKIHRDTLLIIAGGFRRETDSYAQSIRRLIMEKPLTKSIMVTGFVPEEKLPIYFLASEIIVLPYTETDVLGSSEVLAEVASVGKPIVATRTPKLLGLLHDGHNALLVDPGSVEQLATAILRVLSDEQLATSLATTLRQEALASTWDKIGLATLNVYNHVMRLH